MAAPTGNILSLPFRRTHGVSLSEAIEQYISSKYDQHPDTFADDLAQIDTLRKNAVSIQEPHPTGIRRLQCYAAQLVWMGAKFPIDVGADFTWYPSLGYETSTPMSQNNIRFELANVLFNLAVLYCQLAVNSNRSTSEGLKSASNYFCLSAGVISHLKSETVPEMRSTAPDDMDPMTLECLEQLLLSQAQECFWQKAVKDGFKDASIAKLAAGVSDLYLQAYEYATKSNTISSEWIHHMNAKHNHFASAAQYRAACDCLEKRKYGEEVARLRDSVACANNALKEARYVNKVVLADLHGLKSKVEDDLKRAERDNDMIYLIPVPPKSELKTLDRANMVSARVPKEVSEPISMLGDSGELGRPLFSKLVPYAVHVAASVYASRRDQTVNSIIDELEALTGRVHSLLQSLNLPGSLQALEKPLGIPPGLTSHAEEIRQQRGPERLRRSMNDVDKLKAAARATYNDGVSLLQSEAQEDDTARRRYGTERWDRLTSQQSAQRLYAQVSEIDGYLNSAENSDANVRIKHADNESIIRLLSSNDRALEDYVPSSRQAVITPSVQREVNRLRNSLNEATRLESRRRRKIEALRGKAQADDVNPELLKETARLERDMPMQAVSAVQFEGFFDKRLERYDVDRLAIENEKQEQESTLNDVAEANKAFINARRGDNSTTRDRERTLQKLENAFFAYKEIIQNLEVGRKFYNELAALIGKFRDDSREFAYHRRTEAAQLEADITNALPMANLNLNPQISTEPTESQQRQQHVTNSHRTRQQPPRGSDGGLAREPRPTPLPAPVPVKPAPVADMRSPGAGSMASGPINGTWDPDMPIKFAGITTPQGQGQGQGQRQGQNPQTRARDTRWDPNQGLKFGP